MSGTTRTEVPDNAYECFDYIVNTHKLYNLLGESLGLLIRRAKRHRHPVEDELRGATGINLGDGSPLWSVWLRRAREVVREAIKDYGKFFVEEDPKPDWLHNVDERDVLRVALQHKD